MDRISRLRKEVTNFPKLPGVYLMRDAGKQVIYVGKAKDLRSRVKSYFAGGDGRSQIEFLLKRIETIEFVVTENEDQAFVLERDLINRHKPRYNIRLKDDKAFLSVRLDENAEWPRLELVRRVEADGARYFGPFSFSYELRNLLEIVKRVVPLRTCSNTVFYNRQRPCLEYQIKRCAGPCCLAVKPEDYRDWVKQAVSILEGKTTELERELKQQMERASEELRFEDAAVLRDRINTLQHFRSGRPITSNFSEDRDVFALYREERLATLAVLQVRLGRISNSLNFAFTDVTIPDSEVLQSALEQFYSGGREIPEEIIVPCEIPEKDFLRTRLEEQRQAKVDLVVPQRGIKFRLLGLANVNAKQHFIGRYDAETRYMEVAKALAVKCSLPQIPRRIECVDISNLQGSDIVGALVSFFDGVPDKSSYRRYKISLSSKPDDFASIYEVVQRRLRRGKQDGDLPDLIIIDGGAQQLAKALQARDVEDLRLDFIALAKSRLKPDTAQGKSQRTPERIFVANQPDPIALAPDSELSHFLERIRDEAHRYVI
ncbi:MAG: excinuclease ABC subunit UvrC, partial [Bdellovibrionales bacterium]|nr:excinuclease ABC subunit UvrC [Bdellovibrionales bacterium]